MLATGSVDLPPWASLENDGCPNTQVRVFAVKTACGSDKNPSKGSLVSLGRSAGAGGTLCGSKRKPGRERLSESVGLIAL